MKDSVSWLKPSEAAALEGCSVRKIQNMITSGKLSATRDDGKYFIEKSEFFRVFPDAHRKYIAGNPAIKAEKSIRMEIENEYLKERVSKQEKENEFLKSQIESFTQEKKQMLEAITHHSRLLEDKRSKYKANKSSWWDIFKRN